MLNQLQVLSAPKKSSASYSDCNLPRTAVLPSTFTSECYAPSRMDRLHGAFLMLLSVGTAITRLLISKSLV